MNKKYFYTLYSFVVILFIGMFYDARPASALTYLYTCPDGGVVTTTVNMAPTGPFTAGTATTFQATGQLTSTCTSRKVNLTAKNNSGTPVTLIPDTTMNVNTNLPLIPAVTSFTSPTAAGSYKVTFQTGVETTPANVDLCPNIPGTQLAYSSDIYADPEIPGDCISVIRGTARAGLTGGVPINMAGSAWFNNVILKNITITSVGGVATNVWPSTTPLFINWSYCAKWNSAYAGGSSPSFGFSFRGIPVGNHTVGECRDFPVGWSHPLPYGAYTWSVNNYQYVPSLWRHDGAYTAWDGIHQGTYPPYISDSPGFFSGIQYKNSNIYARTMGEGWHQIFNKKNYADDGHAEIKVPLEKLVFTKMELPAGYRLILTSGDPATQFEGYPYTDTVAIKNASVPNLARVNVYIPGGFGKDIVVGKTSYDLPNGTYQTLVQCNNPTHTGTAIPSSFTIPHDGGVFLKVSC